MNLAESIARAGRHRPHAPAILYGERMLGHAELAVTAGRIAALLASRGAGVGTHVGVSMGNTPEHVATILAIARIGAVVVALNPSVDGALREGIAKRYRVALLAREPGKPALPGVPEVVVEHGRLAEAAAGLAVPRLVPGGDLPWRIALSSGTTGVPKGTVWTHRRTITQLLFLLADDRSSSGRRYLIHLDLNMAFALHATLRFLLDGATVVLAADPDPAKIPALVERHGVDHLRTSPAIVSRILETIGPGRARLERLQSLTLGGSPVSRELMQRVQSVLTPRVVLDYGATEFGGVARCDPLLHARHPDAAGRVLPWIEVRIEDDEGRALPVGELGRVGLRSAGPMPEGYFEDPENTARSYRDGWFFPGDLGRLTRSGALLLAGRADDMVSVGGVKMNLVEIDQAIESFPGVVEGAGFVATSPRGEPVLVAAVVAREDLDEAALRRHCASRLRGRGPSYVVRLTALPRNPAGKLLRRELQQRVRVSPAGPAAGTA
jgi:acyl-coenzyme A synthetase/AMP-(fatty) acid ligase